MILQKSPSCTSEPLTGYARIELTHGLTAIVDAVLYNGLNRYYWRAVKSGSCVYAVRREYRNGRYKTIRMHREIAQTPDGFQCHHCNGDPLDNRKANLVNIAPLEHAYLHGWR